jgi:aryl-alcohol dehydrogenase-like predicted oxidoreductase
MEYRTPHGTDLAVPRLVLGTMTFGAQVDRETAAAMVARCREAGVTMFDTANSYGSGVAEQLLGEVVAPYRDEVLIASKVFNRMGDGPKDCGLRRPAIEKALNATLRRLGTDHLDIYYLHAPDRSAPIEEALAAMAAAVAAGKVRHVGMSNYAAWQIAEARCLTGSHGWPAVHLSQPLYNLLSRRVEDEYAEFSEHYAMHNVVYNPLAGGLLSGKHNDAVRPEAGGRFAGELGPMYRDRYWNQAQFHAVEALRKVAANAGLTLVELAFRWLMGRPLVDSILLGASRLDQLEANLAAANGPALGADVLSACDDVWASLRGAAPAYNR